MEMKIIIKKEKQRNLFSVNGHELKFRWHKNKIKELETLLMKILSAVSRNDYRMVSFLLLENRNNNLSNLIRALETLQKNEFIHFVHNICDLFITERKQITVPALFDFMVWNSIDSQDSWDTRLNTTHHYLSKNNFKSIADEYIFSKIRNGFKTYDKSFLWAIIPLIGRPYFFQKLQSELYEEFIFYVRECGNEFLNNNKTIEYSHFASYCLTGIENLQYYRHNYKHLQTLPILKEVSTNIKLVYLKNLEEHYKFEDDEWLIITKRNVQSVTTRTLIFSDINTDLKTEVKQYIQHLLSTSDAKTNIQATLSHIKLTLREFHALSYYEITTLSNINYYHVLHLINHFQQLKKEDNTRLYSLGTIRGIFTTMRLLMDWHITNHSLEMDNPYRKYEFRNAHSFATKHNEYIPENIVKQLEEKLGEAPLYVQNIWTIMMNTGMRISEALRLDTNCLDYNPKISMYELEYIPSKSGQARANNALDKYHKIPINSSVVDAINKQIDLSLNLRSESNSNKIFLSKRYSIITQPTKSTIANHINVVIKKNNIRDINGEIFHYQHHMCRKTLVVELLTNGESLAATADYISHLSAETTKRYYAEIEHEKRAKLDKNMFTKLFEETLDEETKKQFTFAEKESLIDEITLGSRDTPEGHGYCTKHVSFGPCQKKKCVGCKMLITGPQKLPMWYKLYDEQERYLSELKSEYKKNNIDDYEQYRLFQEQVRLRDIYKDTITKVEAFAIKEGILFEKQTDENIK